MTRSIRSHSIVSGLVAQSVCALFVSSCVFSPVFLAEGSALVRSGSLLATQTPVPSNQQEITVLEPGKPLEREIAGGQSHAYRITLSGGQYACIIAEQHGIDVALQVLDATGKSIAEFDAESRKNGQERAGLVAESPATIQLSVKAVYAKDPAARYTLRVVEIRAATEQDRAVYEAHRLSAEASNLGGAGKYDEALKNAEHALKLGEKALGPNDPYIGSLATKLAILERTKGDYAKAELMFQRAVSIQQKALGKEDPQTALALDGLGVVYRFTNDSARAEQLIQQAMEITEKSLGSEHPRMAICLMQMAGLHQDRGDFGRAVPELQRALAIAEKTLEPDDFLQIALLHNLGDIYLNQNDLDHAEPLTQRALQLLEKKYGPDHPNVAVSLQNLGSIARMRKQYSRALELLWRAHQIREKALGSQHPETAALLLNIGNVYKDEGDYPKALELYQRALGILENSAGPYHRLTMMSLANLANTYFAQGDSTRGIEYQARTDQVVEKNFELNLAIGSERAKLAYMNWMSERTDRTVSHHVQRAPNDNAASELAALVVLQRKSRVLDAVSGNLEALRKHLGADDQKLLDELGSSTAAVAKAALNGPGKTPPAEYSRKLALLEEQREKLESEISRRSAGYYQRTSTVGLADIKAAIPADAALIEFTVYRPFDPKARDEDQGQYGDPRYVAYVITRQGDVRWKELGDAREIDGAVDRLREALREPKRSDARQLARALDEKVMQPVRALVGDATHLLISPDGELNLIPFEALLDGHGHYAVENYSISYLTTGRDLLRMHVARESKSEALVFADPFFGEPGVTHIADSGHPQRKPVSSAIARRSITTGKDLASVYFAPLTGTTEEAHAIKRLFPRAELLIGPQATKSAIMKANAPRIMHIATHGFFLTGAAPDSAQASARTGVRGTRAISASAKIDNPLLRSGLALAGANLNKGGGDDGILTALEASNLNLWGTKLVTLSACDTGVGEVKNGEGVYGLRRAFFLAGAESLVMSLWPVSDYVTRELMTNYYTGLKKGLGRGDALRQAQLTMLKHKGRQHPFYWASFIQSGEWASLDGKR